MTTPPVDLQGDRGALREVPYMGVIFVVAEASKLGFVNGHPDWSNLGQGQPEVGAMRGAPPRFDAVRITPEDHAYGPLEGIPELREMVAEHYNRLYRRDKASRYTAGQRRHRLRRALDHKVLTVPGEFFDVNPGKFRGGRSLYRQWMRFSFGPPMDNMNMGLDRLAAMVRGD